jgi:hypothetical protein
VNKPLPPFHIFLISVLEVVALPVLAVSGGWGLEPIAAGFLYDNLPIASPAFLLSNKISLCPFTFLIVFFMKENFVRKLQPLAVNLVKYGKKTWF